FLPTGDQRSTESPPSAVLLRRTGRPTVWGSDARPFLGLKTTHDTFHFYSQWRPGLPLAGLGFRRRRSAGHRALYRVTPVRLPQSRVEPVPGLVAAGLRVLCGPISRLTPLSSLVRISVAAVPAKFALPRHRPRAPEAAPARSALVRHPAGTIIRLDGPVARFSLPLSHA